MKRTVCFVWTLLLIALMLCTAFAEANDPVVVRVGDFTYTQSVVQGSLDSMRDLSQVLEGEAPSEEEKAERVQATIDSFVRLGVIENKLAEAGKNDFTKTEQNELEQTARSKYEEMWQALYQQMQQSDASVSEETVTAQLEGMGFTYDAIYDELALQMRQNRAIELYCSDVVITQAQVDAYYEEQFVAPDREDYKDNVERYDQEILMGNNEAFYVPEGYRYIRQIVLKIPQEALNATASDKVRYNRAANAVSTALQSLATTVVEVEDLSDEKLAAAKAAYTEAADALETAALEYRDALEATALPLVQEKVDEIRAAHDAGIDFRSLVKQYSIDLTERNVAGDGYPFHPDSKMWPEPFRAAAAALEHIGDISDPVVTEQGVHIISYVGDVPAGDHVPTEEERKLINAGAQRYYQLEKLYALIDEWKADYDIETHSELIRY